MSVGTSSLLFTKIAAIARSNHADARAYVRQLAISVDQSSNFTLVNSNNADLIILAGGDGFALNAIKKYGYLRTPFLGISFGDVGFFMNPTVNPKKLLEMLTDFSSHFASQIYPLLEGTFTETDARPLSQTALAFNEIVLERVHGQALRLDVEIGGEKLNTFSGDALMVSTPQGTTGYAINTGVGAPAMHPDIVCKILVPMNPQKSWKYRSLLFPVVLPADVPIRIRVLEHDKRPAHLVCDGVSLGKVMEASVTMAQDTVSLLRFSDPSFRTSHTAKLVDKIIGPPRDMT
jgi:NAD+ kinase